MTMNREQLNLWAELMRERLEGPTMIAMERQQWRELAERVLEKTFELREKRKPVQSEPSQARRAEYLKGKR